MVHTSSKIKIGAFFNNALAIAILCRHHKEKYRQQSFIYIPRQTCKVSSMHTIIRPCCKRDQLVLRSLIYEAYLALTTTKKTSSLSYHSIVALQNQFLKVIRSKFIDAYKDFASRRIGAVYPIVCRVVSPSRRSGYQRYQIVSRNLKRKSFQQSCRSSYGHSDHKEEKLKEGRLIGTLLPREVIQ